MWVLKSRGIHKTCIYTPKVVKTKVIQSYYPLGFYEKEDRIYFSMVLNLCGKEEDKKKFIRLLRKDKKIKKIEIKGNLIFTLVEENRKEGYYDPFYNPAIFYTKPALIKPDGYEYSEIASFSKESLEGIIKILKNKKLTPDYKIYGLSNRKLDDLLIPHFVPKLTDKQKTAIELAYKNGYYEIPRKITLEALAKSMKISKQAFAEHLTKAEKKLMPYLIESNID